MLVMTVGNSNLAGGGFYVPPEASLEDGLLDVAAVTYRPQLTEFTIEASESLHFNLDGEPLLESRYVFSVLPRHLGVAY